MSRGEPLPGAPSLTQPIAEEKHVPTFEEFSKEWYETYVMTVNKHSEQYTKEGVLRVHLVPFFGQTPIDKISAYQIEQFKSLKVKAKLNPKTINNFLACLRKCLQSAIDWEKISTMPKMKKFPIDGGRIDFLSPIESAQLLTDTGHPTINGMTLMGLRTGMRFGELIGLDWSDVDLDKRRINVKRNKVMGKIGTPKNGKTRSIDIASDLHAYLIQQPKKKGAVFQLQDGRELTHHLALNALKRSCERVNVRKVSWHVLRHTTASQLVAEGVPLNVVKELLGHSNILMTMKYAHLAPSAIKDAVELFSKIEQRELNKIGTETALT
jgi:integrase